MLTKAWAMAHGISADPTPPPVADYNEPRGRTARDVAMRAVILQGVVAVGAGVDPAPVIDWFQNQGMWVEVTADEKSFLANPTPTMDESHRFCWHQEAEWTLLWTLGMVGHLGLPTSCCDTGRLVDQLDKSLEYVLKLDCVDAMTIGFEKTAEVDDTINRMEKAAKAQAATSAGGCGRRVLLGSRSLARRSSCPRRS